MATADEAVRERREGLVRPEFGPTGPELVRRHLGPRGRRVAAVLAAVAVVALAVLIATRAGDGLTQLDHRSAPQFTLLYPPGTVDRVTPQGGELVRLRSERGNLRIVVTVRRLTLPPYRGRVSGLLPVFADRQTAALARELPGFHFRTDGKARVNDAPGYQLRYRAGPESRRTQGTDVLVVPEDGRRDGVLLRYRQTNPVGALDDADRELVKSTKKAFRSFRFGLDRP
jgi:hypothetical protein